MSVTDRRLPWLPSIAGSVVIHGAFAALALSVLPQLPPVPEETKISIAPLDASTVNPLQPNEVLEARPVSHSPTAGQQVSAGVAPPLSSAQSAPASGQQSSAKAIETGVAAPFAAPTIASSPVPSDSVGPLEPAAISSLLPSVPADRPLQDAILPLNGAQLPPEAAEARTASAPAEQKSARPLPSVTAETIPTGDNVPALLMGAMSADPVARPISIAPLDAPAEAAPAAEAEVAAPVSPAQVAALPTPVRAEPPLTMQTAEPSPTGQTAGPVAGASIEGSPLPATAADPVTAATIAPSATSTAPADGVTTDLAASLPPSRADTVVRSSVAEVLDTTGRVASDLPPAFAKQTAGPVADSSVQGSPLPATAADPVAAAMIAPLAATTAPAVGVATDLAVSLSPSRADTVVRSSVAEVLDTTGRVASDLPPAIAKQTAGPVADSSVQGSPLPTTAADPVTAATIAPLAATTAPAVGVATDLAVSLSPSRADAVARSSVAEVLDAAGRAASDRPTAVADPSVPSGSVAASNEALLAAAPPGTPPAAEQVDAERMDAGAVAAASVSPTPTATIAPAIAASRTADPVRTFTVQFVQAGDGAADAAVLPMAQTAVAPEVGGNAFGPDGDAPGSAASAAAPISRQVFAAPGPVPGAIAAEPVTPPTMAELADIIRDYSEEECLAAVVGTRSDGLVQVRAYGQATTIAGFARDLRAQMGEMVPLSTTVVSGAQCTVLEAMQNWTGYPATGPALELSSNEIASGGTVIASVPGAPTEWTYLLLVDQEGTAVKLAEYVAEAEGTTRSAPPVQISRSGNTPQLIVSVVSPTALTSMAEDGAQPAGEVFQALQSELERRQIRATLSVTAFTVQ